MFLICFFDEPYDAIVFLIHVFDAGYLSSFLVDRVVWFSQKLLNSIN